MILSTNKNFFKPTLLYKEYMILNMIEKDPNITQRQISTAIQSAVSMVNSYLDIYEKQGLLTKEHITTKTVMYHITKKGVERRKFLNIGYLNNAQKIYDSAKENIEQFLVNMTNKGLKDILLYGAGEVAEILLHAINSSKSIIYVVAVIDDNIDKKDSYLVGKRIISIEDINRYSHDAIFISSFTNHETIYNKLINNRFPKDKIIQFFDI